MMLLTIWKQDKRLPSYGKAREYHALRSHDHEQGILQYDDFLSAVVFIFFQTDFGISMFFLKINYEN